MRATVALEINDQTYSNFWLALFLSLDMVLAFVSEINFDCCYPILLGLRLFGLRIPHRAPITCNNGSAMVWLKSITVQI
jgi:hypothetical protein